MSKTEKLQRLVNRIPDLKGCVVKYRRGSGYYVQHHSKQYTWGVESLHWFERYDIGERWLNDWIRTGRRPAMSQLRAGSNQKRQSLSFEDAAAWVPRARTA